MWFYTVTLKTSLFSGKLHPVCVEIKFKRENIIFNVYHTATVKIKKLSKYYNW